MAFALNSLKSGAVTQLAKNVDQNRLTLLAQSANAEVIAMIRSKVNLDPASRIFHNFRSIFPDTDGNIPPLRQPIVLFSNFEPQQTLEIAQNVGYKLKIKSKAVLTAYREAPARSVTAFNAYLDVYSQAYREGFEENLIEVHERRDIRLVDLRHRLDRYALFVKNYGPDYNNPRRRLVVDGIEGSGPDKSHIYLGNFNYPDSADPQKYLWLDVYTPETRNLPGFAPVTAYTGLVGFENATMPACLFSRHKFPYGSLGSIEDKYFYKVQTVIDLYETFVNQAANGALGNPDLPRKTGTALVQKCGQAMAATNSNAAAYEICDDFRSNYIAADGGQYHKCAGFMKILNTCFEQWQYVFGYTDAASIWKLDNYTPPALPMPKTWATSLAFGGLATTTVQYRHKGPYFAENLDEKYSDELKKSVIFNPERIKVGKMAKLYGEDNDKSVIIEGPVFLRYFKVGFFDEFKKTINFYRADKVINPAPVPLNFYRYDKPETFLNKTIAELPTGGVKPEKFLMSRDVASFPINSLLGDTIEYYDGNGVPAVMNPISTFGFPNFTNPITPPGTSIPGTSFGRLIDYRTVSWNYPNSATFLAQRVANLKGEKTLFLDGVIYIEEGDLDLTGITRFYGKGMIYLGRGNCTIGNFRRAEKRPKDTVRFYLRRGDFLIESASDEVYIEASLAAFFYPFRSKNPLYQGSLILNGKSRVTIYGNLLVDYLYTEDKSGRGLAYGGKLHIIHDPKIYDAAAEIDGQKLDPYHVSIGPVRTLYSVNSGGKTF
jgi:hypothetical protein